MSQNIQVKPNDPPGSMIPQSSNPLVPITSVQSYHATYPYLKRRAIIPLPAPDAGKHEREALDPDCDVDLNQVQGDVYYMFPKNFEQFIFFTISDKAKFKTELDTYRPYVTTSKQTIDNINKIANRTSGDQLDIVSTGIAFSKVGLKYLGTGALLQDQHFDNGPMINEKPKLGDTGKWDDVFNNGKIHGVIIVTAGKKDTCETKAKFYRNIFSKSIKDAGITKLYGRVRSGEGEHFGWRDGISQPALRYLSDPHPGQRVVDPGVVILGYKGDPVFNTSEVSRPDFTKNGSFMVFRKLEQSVLGLEDYVNKNYVSIPADDPKYGKPLTIKERKDLFSARLVGRFKMGAPLAKTPYRDDTSFLDPSKINNFDYTTGKTDGGPPYCPFAAHIRKTAPRNLDPLIAKEYLDASVLVRAGVPYGEEITQKERDDWSKLNQDQKDKATSPRGLLFVCYQSSIENGFFRQTGFASNDFFPITDVVPQKHGQDPILGGPPKAVAGQANIPGEGKVTLNLVGTDSSKYEVTGFAKAVDTSATAYTQDFFVTSRGGEYFFVPSIATLKAWGDNK